MIWAFYCKGQKNFVVGPYA